MTLALYGKTKRRQGGLMLAALMAILFATLGGVAVYKVALADAGNPTTLTAVADTTNPLQITVSGNWSWTDCAGKYVGWAVAWGETGYTSNPVSAVGPPALGPYYMGESGAYPATQGNHVFSALDANPSALSPCPPTGATSGTWGPLTHTYAAAGTYNICVVIYDIQKKSGTVPVNKAHSAVAGGTDHNTDNSVETNFTGSGNCSPTRIVVAPPPKLTVTKVVVNTGGGTKVVADFPLKVDTTPVTSGVQITSTAGSHTVSETGAANYTAVITGDCNSSGVVVLAAGNVKACTITNTYTAPPPATRQITVKKVRLGNGPAAETFAGSISGAGAVDTSWSIFTAAGNNQTSQNRTITNNLAANILETLTAAQTAAGWQLVGFNRLPGLGAACGPDTYVGPSVNSVPADTASYTLCVYNTFAPMGTVVVKKITTGSASNDTDKFGVLVKLGAATAQTILATDVPGLSESTPKVYTGQTAGSSYLKQSSIGISRCIAYYCSIAICC